MTSHVVILPFSKERNDEVSSELSSKNLGEEVNVRHESSLQNNWNVGSVEQLDWVWLSESSHFLAAQRELNSESLEIDGDQSDNHSREQVAKVWGILSIDSLLKSVKFVWLGQQEVEESNDASFEFGSLI